MKTNINLLPWRDAIEKRGHRKLLSGILAQIILTFFLCVLIYFYSSSRADSSGPDRAILNNAINQANQQIRVLSLNKEKFDQLKLKTAILLNLHDKKYQTLVILQSVIKSLPKTAKLDRIVKKDNELTLYGEAPSNAEVTELIDNLATSQVILNPLLRESKTLTQDNESVISFQIDSEITPKYNFLRMKDDTENKK